MYFRLSTKICISLTASSHILYQLRSIFRVCRQYRLRLKDCARPDRNVDGWGLEFDGVSLASLSEFRRKSVLSEAITEGSSSLCFSITSCIVARNILFRSKRNLYPNKYTVEDK